MTEIQKEYITKKFPNVEFFNEMKCKNGYYYFTVILSDWATMNFRNSVFEVSSIENRNNTYVTLKIKASYLDKNAEISK